MSDDIFIKFDDRAYLHEGGTKYYRLISIMVKRGDMQVNALVTNYGPHKLGKDEGIQLPRQGGTSAIQYFDREAMLVRKFGSEHVRRLGRGYAQKANRAEEYMISDDVLLEDTLRRELGLILGHVQEIQTSLLASISAGDEIDTLAGKRAAPKREKPPAEPAPPVVRGEEWGSW